MNNAEFDARLNMISETLFNSGFLKDTNRHNFTGAELAQIQTGLSQIAVNAVIAMEKADLERETLAMQKTKMQNELELAIARAKIENMKIWADAIASMVQAESIKRSVVDNALINKANASISLFNVATNAVANNSADLSGVLSSYASYTKETIDAIDVSALGSNYDDLLATLTSNAKALDGLVDGTRKVQIMTPTTTIMHGEPLMLFGISLYGNNECEFIDGEISEKSRFYTFIGQNEGKKDIEKDIVFRVKNNDDEWIEDRITIIITPFKPKEEE